jgi:putative AlgH/UPF0301 family transcriptional regulator
MTKKEINQIAEAVVELLMSKQKLIDEEFKKDVENMLDSQEDVSFGLITQEDVNIKKLEKLEDNLSEAISREDYTECEKLKKMITKFKKDNDM